MLHRNHRHTSGFTLVELAIVLGIAGVLIGGVWRLLAAGNQQTRDQTAANQHAQLISSLQSWFQTDDGIAYLSGIGASSTAFILPAPAAANCAAASSSPTPPASFCTALPPGFQNTNAYGQQYVIGILKDSSAAAPQSYSFMVMSSRRNQGEVIPDTSGGRISAMIGGDGGFLYSSEVCGAGNACGAYGSWATNPSMYGLTLAGYVFTGQIASITYYGSQWSATNPWLARVTMGAGTPPEYNVMHTPLYLGSGAAPATLFAQGNTIDMAASGATTGGGTIAMHEGTINLSDASKIEGTLTGAGGISLTKDMSGGAASAALTLNSGNPTCYTCNSILLVSGNETVTGKFDANYIYAWTFLYSPSDVGLKKDIMPLSNSLETLMKVKPVSFTFKSNDVKSMGVIAQELEKIYPQLVGDMKGGQKAVAYQGLIAPLIDAVQQLKRENDDLRAQLKDIAARQSALETRMKK